MKIDNAFEVPLPIHEAWAVLIDIERIAPCMPGAELTEVIDDRSYKGKVAVRLGPVALSFNGTARFEEIDEADYRARVKAAGTDGKGRGGAQAEVAFELRPKGDFTEVLIHTELQLSGAVAQYGRGSGMISDFSSHLVSQFADSLKRQLAEVADGQATSEAAAEPGPAARPAAPTQPVAPISGFTLGIRLVWMALSRRIRRLFARG